MDEHTIISRVVGGETDAYRLLVDRYHVGLIIHCEGLMKDRDHAEDVAQEAFIKAYQRLNTFDADKAKFSTWLYRIATNYAIDELRKRKHFADVEDIETLVDVTMPYAPMFDEKDAVRMAVARLMPPHYRQVIEAYFWHGKSYKQIAAEHNIPTATVGTWISRAKGQLREELS